MRCSTGLRRRCAPAVQQAVVHLFVLNPGRCSTRMYMLRVFTSQPQHHLAACCASIPKVCLPDSKWAHRMRKHTRS